MKRLSSSILAGALALTLIQLPAASATQARLSTVDAGEISTGYSYLTNNFYQKVDAQAVLDSVRLQLLAALRGAGVKNASLPALHAGDGASSNVHEIDREVEAAAGEAKAKLSTHALSYAALDGMLRSVHDRYTVFLTPKEFAGLNEGLDGGDFGGTGIVIQVDDTTKFVSVENVVPNGPADKAGIEQDDLITTIDGASTKGMTLNAASAKLRGKEGTRVTLTISRDKGRAGRSGYDHARENPPAERLSEDAPREDRIRRVDRLRTRHRRRARRRARPLAAGGRASAGSRPAR